MTEPSHTVRRAPSSVLRRMWLYAVVIAAGLLLWLVAWGAHIQTIPDTASDDTIGMTGAVMLLDLVLGIIAVSILPLRSRAPLTAAIITSATLALSTSAIPAAVFAIIHLAFFARRLGLAVAGVVWTLAILINGAIVFPILGMTANATEVFILGAVGILLYVVWVVIGRYRRVRAETLALLRERADDAEKEREREVRTAQEAERLRIAREMHDVLAHRISLVSMHAGALTFRDDLSREKIAETAHVIQESSALALTELRGMLGVLRHAEADGPRSPQPVLDHLPILLADARAAGVSIEVEFSGMEVRDEQPLAPGLTEATSRAAYRFVQEALTNARKHAPGETIRIRITRVHDKLYLASANRLPKNAGASVPSGMGIVGLRERAELLGGNLTSGPTAGFFVLKLEVPWT